MSTCYECHQNDCVCPPELRWLPVARADLKDGDRVRERREGNWHHRWGVTPVNSSRPLHSRESVTYERLETPEGNR